MKKIYIVLIMVVAFATTTMAQNYTVVFAVDANQMASVSTNGISIAGNFQVAAGMPAEWSPADGAMEDADGNGVWQITVSIPAGTYVYKYINGNDWGDNEGTASTSLDATCSLDDGAGNINREITISSDTVVGPYFYDACTESTEVLSVNKISTEATMLVAPNPMGERAAIFLSNPNNEVFTMTMTNIMGQVVRTPSNINTNVVEIEKADLTSGVYFVTLQNEAGARITEKLIVQ
jgi:hypothetical protein